MKVARIFSNFEEHAEKRCSFSKFLDFNLNFIMIVPEIYFIFDWIFIAFSINYYYAYHHIRVDSQLLLNFMYKRKALWTGSVARRLATTPKIGREAPRDDDFSIIAKKHFFNNFQHFLTFFNMFSTYFHARNNVENIFHIFNIYRRVARRHATTQRAPKIGREAPRDDPKGT